MIISRNTLLDMKELHNIAASDTSTDRGRIALRILGAHLDRLCEYADDRKKTKRHNRLINAIKTPIENAPQPTAATGGEG